MPPRPFVVPLSLRLCAIVLIAAVVPVLGAGLWSASAMEQDARATAAARMQGTARLGAGIIGRFIARGRDKLTVLARLLGERTQRAGKDGLGEQQLADQLDSQLEPPDLFLSLEYFDNDAGPRSRMNRNSQLLQQAQLTANQLTQQAFRGNEREPAVTMPLTTGQPFVGARAEQFLDITTVPVSAPVRVGEATGGVLLAYLDLRDLVTELQALGADLRLRLLDFGGFAIASVGPELPGERAGHAEPVADLGWRFEVAADSAAIVAQAALARQRAWQWTGLAAVFALVAAIAAAAFIRRPIAAVTRAAQAMTNGDLTARVRLHRRDEIGELGAAFDAMAAALQQLDQAKSDFVATVSHELRTPLTSMRLSLANLQEGVLGELAPAQQTAIGRMAGDVVRLERIVRDTLLLARLEAGAATLAPVACDLRAIVDGAAAPMAVALLARRLRVSVSGSGQARGDAALLTVVVANLLDNAAKFSLDGGEITATVAAGEIVVRDRGPGFATERPFEPFVQGETAGVKNAGVGLGLAIAARIVRLHGGTITAHNDDGGVVTVRIPGAT
ncbi:MAG: HAMP domain-containing histidine kinase [Planctomycetes bacterium]|nr:HAMP domain-containing histidine kinase [Planctomycetota bacterium]